MFTITVVLFCIGILALILQIAMTPKKEWFAFLFYGTVATLLVCLLVKVTWFREIVFGILGLILKLIPWIIGGVVALGILMIILFVLTWIVYDILHPSSVAYWLMNDGEIDKAERLLNKAMTQKYKYSKEEISNIQRYLRAIRMIKERSSKPETAETSTNESAIRLFNNIFRKPLALPVIESKDGSEESAQSKPITPQDQD